MTPETEENLISSVATIAADLKNCIQKLDEHTKADSDNFEKMSEKLDTLIGEDNKRIGAAKNRATFWTAVQVIGGIGGWEMVKRIFHIS